MEAVHEHPVGLAWLKKQERRVGGKNNSNVYKLNVDMLERAAAEAKLFYATSREQSKFDASEIEGSKFEGSNSDPSNNGSASPQILRGDPSMVEGDPSLDPSLDPSSKKPSCRAPAEPDDKPDPEVVITDHAIEVLTHLNQVSGSRFQKSKTSLENIRARLREGHTVPDLKLVIDVKHEHWHGNDEQYQYVDRRCIRRYRQLPKPTATRWLYLLWHRLWLEMVVASTRRNRVHSTNQRIPSLSNLEHA